MSGRAASCESIRRHGSWTIERRYRTAAHPLPSKAAGSRRCAAAVAAGAHKERALPFKFRTPEGGKVASQTGTLPPERHIADSPSEGAPAMAGGTRVASRRFFVERSVAVDWVRLPAKP